MPQPHRQSLSTRPHSISPHTSSRVDYPEQGFPSSYNAPSHAQIGYTGEYETGGFLTARPVDSGFPESAGGAISMQRSTSGGHYRDGSVGSSVRRSPTAHTTTLYGPTGSVVRRSPSQPPSALRSPAHSSVRRSPPTHSSTLYAPTIDSGHRSPSEPSSVLYAPAGYSSTVHPRQSRSQSQSQQPAYYPSGGAQVGFDPTPQYVDGSQYTVPLDHGANASDGRYQSAGPVTHHVPGTIAPEPPYRDIHPQERVAGSQNRGGYEYDDLNENEHLPKGPGHVPAQGRCEWCRFDLLIRFLTNNFIAHTCRMPGCNRAMYFDRRFNEFWEWCSTQHIQYVERDFTSSSQTYISSVRRWDEAWRRSVSVVQSGLASMATDTAEEMLATRGVSRFDNISHDFFHQPTYALAMFFTAGILWHSRPCLIVVFCIFSYSLLPMILPMR